MYGTTILLVTSLAGVHATLPLYVQSLNGYKYAKEYLSDQLQPLYNDVHDSEVRRHKSFGVLAGVAAGLALAAINSSYYEPLIVVQNWIPYAWRNYRDVSQGAHDLLDEATYKIRVVEDLIDAVCHREDINHCNHKVYEIVTTNPITYGRSADLLLQLGKTAELLKRLEININSVTKDLYEIPYLIDHVESKEIRVFVDALKTTYIRMRSMVSARSSSGDEDVESTV